MFEELKELVWMRSKIDGSTCSRSIFDPEGKKQRLAELDKLMAKPRASGTTPKGPRR